MMGRWSSEQRPGCQPGGLSVLGWDLPGSARVRDRWAALYAEGMGMDVTSGTGTRTERLALATWRMPTPPCAGQ